MSRALKGGCSFIFFYSSQAVWLELSYSCVSAHLFFSVLSFSDSFC